MRQRRYDFANWKVGEFRFVSVESEYAAYLVCNAAYVYGRKRGWRFSTRKKAGHVIIRRMK